jgi:hypothetical protein
LSALHSTPLFEQSLDSLPPFGISSDRQELVCSHPDGLIMISLGEFAGYDIGIYILHFQVLFLIAGFTLKGEGLLLLQ